MRGAGVESGASLGEQTDVFGGECVDIFGRDDSVQDALGFEVRGEWELDKDSVDSWVGIEFIEKFQKFIDGCSGG
jgi:hypothetical protein